MIVVIMTFCSKCSNSVMASSSKFLYTFFVSIPQSSFNYNAYFQNTIKMILESIQNRAKYSFPKLKILVIDTSYHLVSNYTLNINTIFI